ncbi:MAG TPA: NAD(P)H-hydrate dehydratase [Bryobacteraceae bacterium]|nr:NAD(P)H-hydrate dehydratase [Bryobacteraceae bacterium]
MKVLTAAQMREADRQAIEAGVPGLILMENAAMRVVEFLAERYAPLDKHHIVVCCGKGNNGGDGLAIARQLGMRFRARVEVVLACEPAELKGDAEANWRMLVVAGCTVVRDLAPGATIIVDALLGTGLEGAPRGRVAELIAAIKKLKKAHIVAVDMPSGLGFDGVRAEATVTFAAPKVEHYLSAEADRVGELVVGAIGISARILNSDPGHWLNVTEPHEVGALLQPRASDGHKGTYGHALIVGGATGKSGAAAMAGLAALRAGAGLVTVACDDSSRMAPELMTAPLDAPPVEGKTVLAIGPGLGTEAGVAALLKRLLDSESLRVLDADALNIVAQKGLSVAGCIVTPHPGEMSRLTGKTAAEIQNGRLEVARDFAMSRRCTLVLKGHRTLIAFEDGTVWINPTGNPGMATGGTGDILTGLIAGLLAQFPDRAREAVIAAVWLHGRAGDRAAEALGEQSVIATDLLRYLPRAMADARV